MPIFRLHHYIFNINKSKIQRHGPPHVFQWFTALKLERGGLPWFALRLFGWGTLSPMNSIVLAKAAEVWVSVFDYEGSGSRPRTLPVRPTLITRLGENVSFKTKIWNCILMWLWLRCPPQWLIHFFLLKEVKQFFGMMVGENNLKRHKVAIYQDAWGVRKLISHILRNLRNDRMPRVPKWHSHNISRIRQPFISVFFFISLPQPSVIWFFNQLASTPRTNNAGRLPRSSLKLGSLSNSIFGRRKRRRVWRKRNQVSIPWCLRTD